MIDSYYNGSDVLTKDHGSSDYTRISPSSIANFFGATRQWWGENFLNETGFTGSTSSILGSIVHHFADVAGKKQPVPTDAAAQVNAYLAKQTVDFNQQEVLSLWKEMSNVLITNCINGVEFHSTEQFIYHKLLDGVYIAGTYDALRPTGNGNYTMRDYKTAGKKPTGISYNYRMQLHSYAYALWKSEGLYTDTTEIEFTVRPTKTLPARHFHFSEPMTSDDYDKIESQLMTIAHSIKLWHDQPELRFALAQDFRLFQPPAPKLFKD